MKRFFLAGFFLLLFSCSFSATLQGSVVSWKTLNPLNNAVIDVNSVPVQRIVSSDGMYGLSLEPGAYMIQAIYYENGAPMLYSLDEIQIVGQGSFTYDLILFPISEADLNRLALLELGGEQGETLPGLTVLILVLLLLAFLLAAFLALKRKGKRAAAEEIQEPAAPESEEGLDKHALEVIGILQRCGNRLTQRELREKVSFGEAKVSLVVAELEELGYVKKIKRGRGNILVLKRLPEN